MASHLIILAVGVVRFSYIKQFGSPDESGTLAFDSYIDICATLWNGYGGEIMQNVPIEEWLMLEKV